MTNRQGSALLLVIAVVVLVEGIVAVMLTAASNRVRLSGDARFAIEGELIARTELARARVHFATGAVLPEGDHQALTGVRPDGWNWSVDLVRYGDLVILSAIATRSRADGLAIAGSRVTLLLTRLPSDTLQRIPSHARF